MAGESSYVKSTQNMFYDGDIVISGIAGRFPDSDNMQHLTENLMNKIDLISGDGRRWMLDHPEIPQRTGKINNVEKFDADYFGVHFMQAHTMDPMGRLLLEHTYEAIVDAGINPRHLRGTKTGVFIGACFSESENTWFYQKLQANGLGITGCTKAMLANTISYWFGINGPSYTVDSACSSSLYAIENAYRAIRFGLCDGAIVGGANLCLHPYMSLQFARLGVLCIDGCSKSFDDDANGYCRAETVGVVYLQKAKDAKRIYATVVHGKKNCDGFTEQGITFPSSMMQSKLLSEVYDECGVSPTMLNYVEAHGTGTQAGDPEELNAIERIFCTGRTTPLKIGSVKSNLGHAESASGICSIAKTLIAMETGLIPPNIHYKRARRGVKSLEDGRIKVVTEVTPWEGGYAGVNSFGFGGANAHLLLKSHTKEKINHGAPKDDLPRLVVASGRTHEAVDSILKDVENRPVDAEYVRLLHELHNDDFFGHRYRGYTIVGGSASQDKPIREIQRYPGAKRPVWFIFSGMGSQWPGMGASLLRLPVFAAAIRKCDDALKSRRLEIYDILTNKDATTFDNILHTFVGIAAIQIGLVDLLNSIGIVPDKMIGHSVGELGCAYADGCLTAEEMILAAYSQGRALLESNTIRGSMAAIGLGYENIKNLCPPDIEVSCHNGPDSSIVSGPAEAVKAFVSKLQASKIIAREIPCSKIAYHSRYIATARTKLLAYLQQVIPEPKPRSPKWVSTSVCHSDWGTTLARLSSAEYHTNNLLSPVLFEESSVLIPKDAVTIEIAPHGLLQDILCRSLHPEVTNIGLTQRGHKDNVEVFLQGLGKLFDVGLHPQLAKLYPDIELPVGRGTPMISPLIKWEHSEDWYVTTYRMQDKLKTGERMVEVTIHDEDYEYMAGHVIDGRNLIPATGYLTLVWETLGMMKGVMHSGLSVVIENVKFLRATTIPKEGAVELMITIQKGTGSFEVIEGDTAIVTGLIRHVTEPSLEQMNLPIPNDDDVVEEMSSKDIYKDLRLRGYNYSGMFRGIKSVTLDSTKGTIAWVNNWVAFMDNMLQISILDIDSNELFVPTGIEKLTIDTKFHLKTLRACKSDEKKFTVRGYKTYNAIIAGGIEIRGLKANVISRKKPAGEPVLETYQFVAHRDNAKTTLTDFITMSAHIALENNFSVKVKTIEAINDGVAPILENLVSPHLVEILGDLPLIQANVNIVATENPFKEDSLPQNIVFEDTKKLDTATSATIASGRDLFTDSNTEMLTKILLALKEEGFLLAFETGNRDDIYKLAAKNSLHIILEKSVNNETALLLRKHCKLPKAMRIINVASKNFEWVPKLKLALQEIAESTFNHAERIILVSEKDFESGLLGLVQCLRREPGGEVIRGYHIQDKKAPDFSTDSPFFANQLKLDLGFNVLRENGTWGTYRHLHIPEAVEQPVYHAWANQLVRGDLSSIRWLEGPIESMSSQKNLARVAYAPLNFRDVMLTTGKIGANLIGETRYGRESTFGFEYSAVDFTGRRVMGLLSSRCLSNIVAVDEWFTWTIPDSWTLEEGATVPCVYATSYYALYNYGRIKRGDKILIHAGTGGVGQSAINLALHEGCEVFTTVGTPEKRKFIRETFPQIPDDHIGNSRDTSFEQMIAKQTNGYGVDIVLNSLAEEKLQASVRCLALGGRFLEIGKFDLAANNPLGMEAFLKEISFHGILLDKLIELTCERKKELTKILQRGINEGAVKPLIRKVFPKDDIEGAFRYMAAGKHIGKVMIEIHDKNEPPDTPMKALPRYYCRTGYSYVILGGLGGFGLELADWLILRGANNLVLTSRTGVKNGYQAKRIALWRNYGVNVVVVVGKDACKREDCENILNTAANMGPVDGIFNLAVILKDALMENQTEATFEESFKAKAWGTKRLDQVSRKICPKLRHFVVFSSVVAGRGNAGQTNYGMANSIMERICERRVAEGLPGLAIQWGAVGDVGLVADMQEEHKELIIGGTLQQKIASCLAELDKFLKQSAPVVASMVVAEKRAASAGPLNVVDAVLNIMGLKDLKGVSIQTSLAELGMDSMMAVEIKQSLEREFEIFLTAQDIRNLNFSTLLDMSTKEAAVKKGRGKLTNSEDTVQGMKLLLQIFGENVLVQEACLKLHTMEEAGRDEIFLIPGIEGYGSIFNKLARKLKSPATCLQLLNNKTMSKMTIADMAEQLVPHILKRGKNRRDFVLVAYSYGSVVAIEVVRKLEAEGMTGRLVLIDGSPELLMAIKDEYLAGAKEVDLQTNIILGIMNIVSPTATPELAVALGKCTTWQEKLDALTSLLHNQTSYMSQEDQRSVCTAVYHRLAALQTYDLTHVPPLRSSIVLLKPSAPTIKNVSPDYGLGMVSREKLEIFIVDGNHVSILDNIEVAAIINGETLGDAKAFKPSNMEERKIIMPITDP